MRRSGLTSAALLMACHLGCGDPPPPPPSPPPPPALELFLERATAAGIDFQHQSGRPERAPGGEGPPLHPAVAMGAGVALFDADGDGDLDLYCVQSGSLPGVGISGKDLAEQPSDRLYRNITVPGEELRFADATAASGLGAATGYGMGVATGDVDGDGRVDLYLTNLGPNQLWLNRSQGDELRFVEAAFGTPADDPRWSLAATFFDYDRDGRLDLFIGNYLEVSTRMPACTGRKGEQIDCPSGFFPGSADRLLRNLGPGKGSAVPVRFQSTTVLAGLVSAGLAGRALGAVAADFDGDGFSDLYVANDSDPNHLWRHLGAAGSAAFEDAAMLAGYHAGAGGGNGANTGVAVADPDRDGDFDLVLAHLRPQTNTMYQQQSPWSFVEVGKASGLGPPSRVSSGFGIGFLDADGDGWLDLFVANGSRYPLARLVEREDPFPFHQRDQLYLHQGAVEPGETPRFLDVTARAGEALITSATSRGVAFGDLDNDGDTDLVISHNHGSPRLLVNRANPPRWIGVRAVHTGPGELAARDALGARVELHLEGEPPRLRRIATDGSYASAGDPRALFALAAEARVEKVRVYWPDGSVEDHPPPEEGRYVSLRQGEGALENDGE